MRCKELLRARFGWNRLRIHACRKISGRSETQLVSIRMLTISILQTYGVTKNNTPGNFLRIYWIQQTQYILLGEQVLTIFLCIKRVRLNWNCIVYDVQNATYSSHGAPCPARDLFPLLNTRVKVHISVWTIREYPKRHFRYLSDSGDTYLPLNLLEKGSVQIPQKYDQSKTPEPCRNRLQYTLSQHQIIPLRNKNQYQEYEIFTLVILFVNINIRHVRFLW